MITSAKVTVLVTFLVLIQKTSAGVIAKTDQDCLSCVSGGKEWCSSMKTCDVLWCPSDHSVVNRINCPQADPDAKFEYDDDFVRKKILITTAAVSSNQPQTCFDNQMPSMKVYNTYNVNCSSLPPAVPCFAYTAVDLEQKVIAISFRGTQNNMQLAEELITYFYNSQRNFTHGAIFSFFYDAFIFLWDSGLHDDILQLKHDHPDFEVWINGHSLGGALASVAASFTVVNNIFRPENIKLVTMGQPRTGDYEYALWHDKTFPYSYRIVHNKDMIPHIPPQLGIGYSMYHHRTEVWYPNDMEVGAEFKKCESADGYYCSATLDFDLTYDDHGLYFVKEMPAWGGAGCPTMWIQ